MKNIISTGVLAIVLTSSSMAGMSINSIETNMSNYTKATFTKASIIEPELIVRKSKSCKTNCKGSS